MALLNIESVLQRVCRGVKKLPQGAGLEILSYKRNRGVAVIRVGDDDYFVRERGYEQAEFQVGGKDLPKILKSIIKREFPRSRKLRVYSVSNVEELDRPKKKL